MRIKVKNSGIVKLWTLKERKRGDLYVIAGRKNVPFSIRRVYFINNLGRVSVLRGGHAHKKQTQAVFCANGSFVLGLDDGKRRQRVFMNKPEIGVLLKPKL